MKKNVKLSLDLKAPILTSDILTDLSSARLITFPEDLSDYIWGHPASVIERPPPAVISERNLWGADATMKRKMERKQKKINQIQRREGYCLCNLINSYEGISIKVFSSTFL